MSDLFLTKEELRARRGGKWALVGEDVLPAWVADMDVRAAPPVADVLGSLVRQSDFGYAYRGGKPLGTAVAEVFADRMRDRFGWEVDPARVLACTDLVQAIFDTVQAFTRPGDRVVVQGPTYDPFREGIEDTGRVMVVDHMTCGGGRWELDLDGLREKAGNASLLMLCNPHNPTGRVFTRDELTAIAEIALEHDLVMVSDEIWADFLFDGGRHLPMASLGPEIAERTVTLYSAGKSFSLAGLRCAVVHFGSEKLQADFHRRFPPRMLGGLNIAGADATITAWQQGGDWFDAVLRQLADNRGAITRWVADLAPAVSGCEPEATYLYWLDCTGLGLDGVTPARFFRDEAKVQLSAGEEFGPDYAGHVRLNFATSPEILGEILDRMGAAIARHRTDGAA